MSKLSRWDHMCKRISDTDDMPLALAIVFIIACSAAGGIVGLIWAFVNVGPFLVLGSLLGISVIYVIHRCVAYFREI